MKSIIQQAASLAVVEARRVDEIKESFEAAATALEAQPQKKESGLPEPDQGLTTQIQDLENRLREKEELLEIRDAELKDIKFRRKATDLAAVKAVRLEEIKGNFEAVVAALVAQLKEKENMLHKRDSELRGLEEKVTGQIRDLENEVREKDELLEIRDAGLKDLKSKNNEAEIAALEAQLEEKEDELHKRDSVLKELKESLTELKERLITQTRDLENRVREKDGLLEIRDAELRELKSKNEGAAASAAIEFRRVKEVKEGLGATVARLEAQLQGKETTLNRESSVPGEQDQGLPSQMRDLESRLREKEEFLVTRDAEIEDLRSKVEEAAALAAAEAGRVQEIERNFAATLAALKTQLGEKEELLSQKDIAMKDMEESLTGLEESLVNQMRILEDQLEEMVQKSGPERSEQGKKAKGKKSSPRSPQQA